MTDSSNKEQILATPERVSSKISPNVVDSQLKNVINFYQKTPEVEKDYGGGIFQMGDSIYFSSAEVNKLTDSSADEFRTEMMEEMLDWETYMYCKENEEQKRCSSIVCDDVPIRNQDCSNIVIQSLSKSRCNNLYNSSSYNGHGESQFVFKEDWDLEIDEQQKTKRERLALEEKSIGNKYFNDQKYREALDYYTKSLSLLPTTDAFNNRAMSFMKLKNFAAAVKDTNEVLKIEPNNLKALYRRATARKEMRMYEEALKDCYSGMELNRKTFLNVFNDIKNEMSKLNGKKYSICPLYGSKKAFEVDVSQLFAYANCNEAYLLEVDRTGCTRSCICGYCTEENRRNRNRSSALRIKERERWKMLTVGLLNEMKITSPPVAKPNDASTSVIVESSIAVNDDSCTVDRQISQSKFDELKNVENIKMNDAQQDAQINSSTSIKS